MSLEQVVADIMCGGSGDVCCLADPKVFAKFVVWLRLFGRDTTKELIAFACKCKAIGKTAPQPSGGGSGGAANPPVGERRLRSPQRVSIRR